MLFVVEAAAGVSRVGRSSESVDSFLLDPAEGPFPAGELILAQTGKDKRNLRNDFISAASDALIITGGNPVQRDRGQAPRPDGDRLLWL
ncbi:hypothetical protein I79_002006 [Cricetulus griseus]|uniref:Uncharacterized protein n=1 Tax=Cricetulus griseus TaxID=10029 RepID=G3GW86_CRIGR|nr:hypothetical protein I79_002006 [Cricetulus griseus]